MVHLAVLFIDRGKGGEPALSCVATGLSPRPPARTEERLVGRMKRQGGNGRKWAERVREMNFIIRSLSLFWLV